ncbi:hypothetical protein MMC18_000296 [Xylographa bjoerkii]|nr:hypothetical protein [Xylographa bjoerkii]
MAQFPISQSSTGIILPPCAPAMQNNSSSDAVSNSEIASVISALGTLIGYLGAEAATVDLFERLLWPQRFYTGMTAKDTLLIGLGMPMGGPLHQAALHTLDKLYRAGLFKGPRLGNMLGTAFFHDSGRKYTVHDQSHSQQRDLLFVIPREGLVKKPRTSWSKEKAAETSQPETLKRFEIRSNGHGFLVVEGNESVVLQFFRHYGHPVRARARENIQIAIIASFGSLFLVGLMLSILCMSVQLQYVWLGYQLYATLAMIVYRYGRGHEWGTVEEKLVRILEDQKDGEAVVYLQDNSGDTVMARLSRTYADSYGEGKAAMMQLLAAGSPGDRFCPKPRTMTADSLDSTMSGETAA